MKAYLGLGAILVVAAVISCDGLAANEVQPGTGQDASSDDAATDANAVGDAASPPNIAADASMSDASEGNEADAAGAGDAAGTEASTNDADSGQAETCEAMVLGDAGAMIPTEGHDAGDAGSEIRVDGNQIDAWGTSLCLDLSGTTAYPGACGMSTLLVGASRDAAFIGSDCHYVYENARPSSLGCTDGWVDANCAREQPIAECWIWEGTRKQTSFTYSGDDLVTVEVHTAGEFTAETQTLSLADNELTSCDIEEEQLCQTSSVTDEEERDFVELQVRQFSAPSMDPEGQESDQSCVTEGSITEGEITQSCTQYDYRFVYSPQGHLVLSVVHDNNPGHVRERERAFLYDAAGNLRYVVYPHDWNDGSWILLIDEYRYDCW